MWIMNNYCNLSTNHCYFLKTLEWFLSKRPKRLPASKSHECIVCVIGRFVNLTNLEPFWSNCFEIATIPSIRGQVMFKNVNWINIFFHNICYILFYDFDFIIIYMYIFSTSKFFLPSYNTLHKLCYMPCFSL